MLRVWVCYGIFLSLCGESSSNEPTSCDYPGSCFVFAFLRSSGGRRYKAKTSLSVLDMVSLAKFTYCQDVIKFAIARMH